MEIQFENLEELSKLSKEKFGVDWSTEIAGLVQIYSIEKYSLSETVGVFGTHYKIQREVTKSNAVDGYEALLISLNKEIDNGDLELLQVNIVTEESGYLMFTDLSFNELFGVLKMNKQRLERKSELNEQNELKGTWTTRKFYLNGVELN